jgi:putative peptide zinc metalloprotease protein
MSKTVVPSQIAGLSRRVVAILAGGLIVISGVIATFAATSATDPAAIDPAASGSSLPAAATSESPSATAPKATPASPEPTEAAVTVTDTGSSSGGAGGNNVVMLNNHQDGRLRVKGSVQINRITASNVAPQNLARAYASCADCDTLAVAMQINLIRRDTTRVVPGNAAVAINYQCSRCRTIAVAFQYTLSVNDPKQTPRDVRDLVKAMDAELRAIASDPVSLADAIDRINAVIGRFVTLAENLDEQRDETTAATTPGAGPEGDQPSPSPSPTASPESSPSESEEAPVSPTPSPSPSPVDASESPPASP